MQKLRKLRKSCNHEQNINGTYNEKLHYNCLQQLPTLRLRTLRGSARTTAQYPVLSLKIQLYSYLVEISQKATLNVYLKSRFLVKPSKFQIYFAKDCSPLMESNPIYRNKLFSI